MLKKQKKGHWGVPFFVVTFVSFKNKIKILPGKNDIKVKILPNYFVTLF